jgi:uncharacterized membrane protein YhdT
VLKTYNSPSKWIVRFCEPAFPDSLPDAAKPWLATLLCAIGWLCFTYFSKQIPIVAEIPVWVMVIALFSALLFVCLYIRGHSLIQAELKAEQEKKEHKKELRRIQEQGISTRRPPIK